MKGKKLSEIIAEKVYNFKTKNREGFIQSEINKLLKEFTSISPVNMTKFNDAFCGNTCMMRDGKIINYHCDVETALRCGIENRDVNSFEWD